MNGIILKDLYNIKNYTKNVIIILLILSTLLLQSNAMIMSKWDRYCLITPLSRKQIVLSKFLVMGIFSLAGIIISTILGLIVGFATNKFSNINDVFNVLIIFIFSTIFSFCLGSVNITFIYKMGVEKSRMYINIILISLLALFIFIIPQLGLNLFGCLAMVCSIIFIFVLFKICCKLYSNYEIS